MEWQGNIALVAVADGGLQLVDFSNPQSPQITGKLPISGLTMGVVVRGNLALIAVRDSGLKLVDISDLRNPRVIGSQDIPGDTWGVALQGNLALSIGSYGLQLIDISDTSRPRILNSLRMLGDPRRVIAQGDLAFAATRYGGLQLVNITDPKVPLSLAQVMTSTNVNNIAVQKNLALLACEGGLNIMDLQTWEWTLKGIAPTTELGQVNTVLFKSSTSGISYQKTVRLLASSRPYVRPEITNISVKPGKDVSFRFTNEWNDASDGILPFQSLQFSPAQSGQQLPAWLSISYKPIVGTQAIPYVFGIALRDHIAFLAATTDGLQIVDVSDPQRPKIIGKQEVYGSARDVVLKDNVAVVAADNMGLQLVDVGDIYHTKVVGRLSLPGDALAVAVTGDLALVAARTEGLHLVDIRDPQRSRLISSLALPGYASGVAVQGNICFVSAYFYNLQIVDISDQQNPTKISSLQLPGDTFYVALKGNLAFIAESIGLLVVDISNPKNPQLIGTQRLPGSSGCVALQGSTALVTSGDAGLHLVNITDPKNPSLMDNIDTRGGSSKVTIQNNLAFVGSSFGLNILQFGLSGAQLSGQPSKADHKNNAIFITARNSAGISGNTTFVLSVNNPPTWQNPILAKTVNVNQVLAFQLPDDVFFDEDGDVLKFSSTLSGGKKLPSWITFSPSGQIYTMIPSSANRGQYNISVFVDDGYYGTAQAWFSLVVPTRKPIKVSDIASQSAFIWRAFELLISPTTFQDLDGDTLHYRAQLKGARPLPAWLRFDNTTCAVGCRFEGKPGATDLSDLEVELVAASPGGEASAEFTIAMRTSTLFQDLATYYSASGGGLVLLSLLVRYWRWKKMGEIRAALAHKDTQEAEIIPESENKRSGDGKESPPEVKVLLQKLLTAIEHQETQMLKQCVLQYSQQALQYTKQQRCTILEIGDPWQAIKKIAEEIERRAIHKLNYQDTFIWCRALQQLLQTLVEAETTHGHTVRKDIKERLLELLSTAKKHIEISKKQGIQIRHQLEMCGEALITMDDTDSLEDNLHCRNFDMIIDIVKTMIAPPYGGLRLVYQIGNVPGGWYPTLIYLCQIQMQARTDSQKLAEIQTALSKQKDWRMIYEGVGLLGKIARSTLDEKIRKQVVEGTSNANGLRHYQNRQGFWEHCSPCCDKQSAWIRARATAEIDSVGQTQSDSEKGSFEGLQDSQIPLLPRSDTLSIQF